MNEAAVWDGLANNYGRIASLFGRSYPAVRGRLVADLAGRGRVLELAAGTGQFTAAIASVAERVVTSDVSEEMVSRLQLAVQEAGLDNVEVRVLSAYAIDASDDSFDAVVCANALHVMESPEVALSEFRRVLRADGRLIVPTFLHGVDGPRRFLSRAMSIASQFVAHTRFDLQGLAKQVEDAGFRVTRAEALPGLFPIGYVVAER